MKKFSIVVVLLSLIALAAISLAYYDYWPFNKKLETLTQKERQSLAERFGISLGGNWPELSDKELNNALDDIASLGFTWIRFDMSWERAQPENGGTIHWEIFDRIVFASAKRRLNLLPILTYAPRWAASQPVSEAFFQYSPSDPAQFADFAQKAARRYSSLGVHAFEIWNEPNIRGFWEPAPNPKDYADLLRMSYIRVKQADPRAIVISGGLAPVKSENGNMSTLVFLNDIYKNGAKNYFDALGYHPYSFPVLPSNKISPNGWWIRMRNPFRSIRSIMTANNDISKQVWATEFGVPTAGRRDFSESLQAKSIEDAAQEMREIPWLRLLFIHTYKDLSDNKGNPENFFGLLRSDGTKKPAYYTIKTLLKGTNRED